MTQSMTAFARQQANYDWGTLVWEIRSVNHRYLEAGVRLPESFRDVEMQCREQIRSSLKRGKVDAQLKFTPNLGISKIKLNEELLLQLKKAQQDISTQIPELTQPSSLDVLSWPGMIEDAGQETEDIKPAVMTLFKLCLDALQEQRAKEGQQLQAFVGQRLDAISEIITDIKKAMPQILRAQQERLKETLHELLEQLDETRLEQEIVMLAQKADISEETDRLEAHVEEVREALKQKDAVGRKLDFLMQELNREANTICSKAVVIDTTLNAVELKVLIEQMREQVQNIE
jgi:uncharacterized protein (TIGR00255 family)